MTIQKIGISAVALILLVVVGAFFYYNADRGNFAHDVGNQHVAVQAPDDVTQDAVDAESEQRTYVTSPEVECTFAYCDYTHGGKVISVQEGTLIVMMHMEDGEVNSQTHPAIFEVIQEDTSYYDVTLETPDVVTKEALSEGDEILFILKDDRIGGVITIIEHSV